MEPQCTVCTHPERKLIENVIAAGGSARKMAVQYSISQSAIQRHKLKHLIPKVKEQAVRRAEKVIQRAEQEVEQAKQAEDRHIEGVQKVWLTRLDGAWQASSDGMARAAADPDKWHLGAQFIGQAIKACDAGLRASGAISPGTTTINVDRMLVLPLAAGEQQQQLAAGDVVDVDAEEVDE